MLNLSTILRFLIFDDGAIRKIASSPKATWVGLLFVISAGFAREYDGEYLIAEPWQLLIPVAASLIGCFVMTVFVQVLAWYRQVRDVHFLSALRAFLNLYWMTAPLAWFYAIPVERMFEPGLATSANLLLLFVVAVLRVALMVRCVQVLYKTHLFAAFVPVILFSDILAMAAIWLVPGPIFLIMGGVRLTESESLILNVRIWMILLGYGTFLIWLISYLVLCRRSNPWRFYRKDFIDEEDANRASGGIWGLVAVSLLVWIPVLPFTQQEQRLRWKSEKLIRAEDYAAFSEVTREHSQSDFPPHWDPPPRMGYGEKHPHLLVVAAGMIKNKAAPWIIDRYQGKLDAMRWPWTEHDTLERFSDEALKELVDAIEILPKSEEIAEAYQFSIQWIFKNKREGLSDERIITLERLRDLGPSITPLDAETDEPPGPH